MVPVYGTSATLPRLISRLEATLKGLAADWEIILVNDGSPDESWEVITRLAAVDRHVRGIDLARNYGQHNAVVCGLGVAKHDIIVTMDDDLQHPPEEIPTLLEALGGRIHVVYGTPQREEHDLWRVVASHASKAVLQKAMGAEVARSISAFRAIHMPAKLRAQRVSAPFVNVDVLLSWTCDGFAAVPVRHDPREHGESSYTFRLLVRHAVTMMVGFSALPLRVASVTGLAFSLFGAAVLAFVLGRYVLQGTTVPGFPFLASIIALFAGAQLFTLGVIGEYVARIHYRTIDRPPFMVRRVVGQPADEAAE